MKKLSVLFVSLIMLIALCVCVSANTLGDADNKDGVTVYDARICLRDAIGTEELAPGSAEYIACDVDGICGISLEDARLILRYAVEIDKDFPASTEIKNHTWDSGKITKAATCAAVGVKTYTCSVCKSTKTEVIEKLTDHTWDSGKMTKAATCAATGVKTYTCTVCKSTKTETVAKLITHTSGAAVKENVVLATCTKQGTYDDVVYCTVCNTEISRTTKTTAMLSHAYDDGVITTPATCGTDGVRTFTCTVCEATKTEVIDKLSHDWGDGEITTPATCETTGVKTYTCSLCKITKTEIIPVAEHELVKHGALPACVSDGNLEYYQCENCDKYFKSDKITETTLDDVIVPAIGSHDYTEKVIEPTCTESGYTELICSRCGSQTVKENSETEAIGHKYSEDWVVKKSSTCTEEGYKTRKCDNCGETVTEIIPLIDHNVDTVEPVNVAGSKEGTDYCHLEFKCSACKQTIFTVENSGHVKSGRPTKSEPSCTTSGSESWTCKYCNYTDTTVIEPLGHEATVEKTVKATCTTDGYILFSGTCTRCGEALEGDASKVVIPATGHTPNRQYADCTNAVICSECKTEITPALGHDYSVTASGLGDSAKRFYCVRCNKISTSQTELLDTFNTLVNGIKAKVNGTYYLIKNPVSIFEKSTSSSSYKSFDFGIYTSMVKDLYDEEMSGDSTEYKAPKENNIVNYYYQIAYNSNVVSNLTTEDINSIKVEKINGITGEQLLSDFSSTFEVGSKTYDISKYKTTSKLADSMIKVTVSIKEDVLKQSGGNVNVSDTSIPTYMKKIMNYDIRDEMFDGGWTYTDKESGSDGDYEITFNMTLKSAKSSGTVTYYFDETTMQPVAAVYELTRTVDQDIDMEFTVSAISIDGNMEPVINTTSVQVYLFVDYLPFEIVN